MVEMVACINEVCLDHKALGAIPSTSKPSDSAYISHFAAHQYSIVNDMFSVGKIRSMSLES